MKDWEGGALVEGLKKVYLELWGRSRGSLVRFLDRVMGGRYKEDWSAAMVLIKRSHLGGTQEMSWEWLRRCEVHSVRRRCRCCLSASICFGKSVIFDDGIQKNGWTVVMEIIGIVMVSLT